MCFSIRLPRVEVLPILMAIIAKSKPIQKTTEMICDYVTDPLCLKASWI